MQYNCECIKGSLLFDINSIRCACANTKGILYQDFSGQDIDFERIEDIRQSFIKSFIDGNPSDVCKNCYMIYEDNSGEIEQPYSKELKYLYISHWNHCNCGCIYCSNLSSTHGKISPEPQKSEYYDILPAIKSLCENGYIGKSTKVMHLGGEITVLKEFDEIYKILSKYTEKGFVFLSSGIDFSQTVYEALKVPDSEIYISLDAGTQEMYKKIKRTDSFYRVIDNVKKYLKANPKAVTLKYILINKINDNIDELKKFIDIAKNIGIRTICLDVDHNRSLCNLNKTIPDAYYEMFDYFSKLQDIKPVLTSQCEKILENNKVF